MITPNVLSWRLIAGVVAGMIGLQLVVHLIAEAFWFRELQYLQVFRLRLGIRFGLFMLTSVVSAGMLFGNLHLAHTRSSGRRGRWQTAEPYSNEPIVSSSNVALHSSSLSALNLWLLLPLTLVISLIISIVVLYHSQIAVSHWHPRISADRQSFPVPSSIHLSAVWHLFRELRQAPELLILVIASSVGMLIYPRWILRAIAFIMSVGFGMVMAEQWPRVLLSIYPTLFEQTDPLFQKDISFYIFQLPIWSLLSFWLIGLGTVTLLSTVLLYFLSGNSLSQGKFSGFTASQLRHLSGIGSGMMGTIALMYWVERYNLLYSPQGVSYGASYTDVTVQLPVYTTLSIIATIFSLVLLGYGLVMRTRVKRSPELIHPSPEPQPTKPIIVKRLNELPRSTIGSPIGLTEQRTQPLSTNRSVVSSLSRSTQPPTGRLGSPSVWLFGGVLAYWAIATLATTLLPALVQQTIVQPNELQFETPYIERTIALTRDALSLDDIETETFDPQASLTAEDLQSNALTINNIRIWDARPLLETNRQLQRIRLYYEFPDADVDRYTLTSHTGESERRQVLISARELNYADLSDDAKTWVNEHLIYTHGYGFTMSPVNTAGDDGLPDYFISGIDHIATTDAVRRSIPVNNPRIYYGELTDTYVMTQTQVRELDFPSGNENEYNIYDGSGGISIAQFWQRMIFAYHLRDWRMLLNQSFTPQTRLLYRRNIRDRVREIAPFLQFDGDPYLVVADITASNPQDVEGDRLYAGLTQSPPNTLYWMIDAYTTSSYFPYADPIDQDLNYIRNSVKVIIDAYSGTTAFYVADDTDPIIRSWEQIFPDMFLPLSAMPEALHEHIRYPQDYYQIQSQHLITYHMTDPQVFYNREDEWRVPSEIYANEQQVVEPYYLTMKLPTGSSEEFILFRPFTPIQRRNLIAWLAARSDGDRYGTQLLYTFPKQDLVFGPEQIEARINQDPVISQQISLWNRAGSRAVQGNLLVIPLEQSLLYVEPLYLEAEQNSLPTLARVIVVFANQIAMAPTLEEALDAIFRLENSDDDSTIVRPVNDGTVESLENDSVLAPELPDE
ncbi:MAG: UPF0182 family protein [Cyanobacteria bacterium P01_A01_bin.37]